MQNLIFRVNASMNCSRTPSSYTTEANPKDDQIQRVFVLHNVTKYKCNLRINIFIKGGERPPLSVG